MQYQRISNILESNSFFLFGARGTGKSTLIKKLLPQSATLYIDLLRPTQERKLRDRPEELAEMLIHAQRTNPDFQWIVIDEVQKVPELLDVVHHLIESTSIRFALTGSSARKLKRGGANLLAGRAFVYYLFPLTAIEVGTTFSLDFALQWGTLPKIFSFKKDLEREMFLESYVNTYLTEEILEEQLVRKVVPFKKFLGIAGQTSGTLVNFANIADDVGADPKTIATYFEILEETLIGFFLPAYEKSLRKQQLHAPKFYLFDTGVTRSLAGAIGGKKPSSQEIGRLFEQFIICEIYRLNSYRRAKFKLYHWATHGGAEVDLVMEDQNGNPILIEIKSTRDVTEDHVKHLIAIHRDFSEFRKICICREEFPRVHQGIEIIPWEIAIMEFDKTFSSHKSTGIF